jgi:hypothetical protein
MDDGLRTAIVGIIAFVVLFLCIILSGSTKEKLINDCKLAAIEKGYPAVEVQAICDRK